MTNRLPDAGNDILLYTGNDNRMYPIQEKTHILPVTGNDILPETGSNRLSDTGDDILPDAGNDTQTILYRQRHTTRHNQ